ncbi:hypothetical protein KPL70_023247 [Citrus sinensis]|nr:hypothetical protein KPL70_023247 [Citrus sinensis]
MGITIQGGRRGPSAAGAWPTTRASGDREVPTAGRQTGGGRTRRSSPDSDLEAFSHNPAHGSFAPLAFQPSAMTNCANQRFLSSKGSIGHAFTVRIRTENQNQTSFYPFVPHEISVLVELILGHLRYLLTDVPPQPNSPPDNVFRPDRPPRIPLVRTSSEPTVRRPGKAPERTVPSPSPGRHAATRSRRGGSSSSPPTADGFGTGTPVPSPQSQSFSRSYGSILPTSLAYIVPSTRGCSPWRPDAVMSTTGRAAGAREAFVSPPIAAASVAEDSDLGQPRAVSAREANLRPHPGAPALVWGGGVGQRCVTPRQTCPRPNGLGRNLRSKTRWFTGFCNSHQSAPGVRCFASRERDESLSPRHGAGRRSARCGRAPPPAAGDINWFAGRSAGQVSTMILPQAANRPRRRDPNTSPDHSIGRSDGRCVQRAGT